MLGLRGMNGFADGLNSLAFGLRVNFLRPVETLSDDEESIDWAVAFVGWVEVADPSECVADVC